MGSCHGHSKPNKLRTKVDDPATAQNDHSASPGKPPITLSPKIRISGTILTEAHHPMAQYIFPRTATL